VGALRPGSVDEDDHRNCAIEVKPGLEAEFEAAVKKATPVFKRSKGCHGTELRRSVEKPSRYRLFVSWETVEDHTVGVIRPSFKSGEASSAIALPHRRRSSTCSRWCTASDAASCDGWTKLTITTDAITFPAA
jgi:heme-degrading monooxygenase HmoA